MIYVCADGAFLLAVWHHTTPLMTDEKKDVKQLLAIVNNLGLLDQDNSFLILFQ